MSSAASRRGTFLIAMITRKAGPALAAGCTVVAKPASQTPFSALALAELGRARRPAERGTECRDGRGDGGGRGAHIESTVRKLSFTGSTEIGKLLMAQCASTVKKAVARAGRQRAVHRVRRCGP